jgi:hypothetical protein
MGFSMVALIVLYLCACLAVAGLGRQTALGFWGTFFVSLVLTPFLIFLLLLAFRPNQKARNLLLRAQLDAYDEDD